MTHLHLDIVSAECHLFSGSVSMVFATGVLGELGITPGHAPLITLLKPGYVKALSLSDHKEDLAQEEVFYISGGILEVQPELVTILADTGIRAESLDEALALEASNQARSQLMQLKGEEDYSLALRELAQAAAQLQAIKKLRR